MVWRFLKYFLITLGVVFLVLTVSLGSLAWVAVASFGGGSFEEDLPDRAVLTLDLRQPLPEVAPFSPFAAFEGQPLTVSELVLALDEAADDPRVVGLVARMGDAGPGLAVAQELRDAIARFQESGRFAWAWADTFGELTPGNNSYYLATAFERIGLQPGGLVGLVGLAIEQPFFEGLLERAGVELEVVRRAEYKTALDSFSEDGFTDANREMLSKLLGDFSGQFAGGIAEGRGLELQRVSELIDQGPFPSRAALDDRLVDSLIYGDDFVDEALDLAGEGAGTVDLAAYAAAVLGEGAEGPMVAVVRAAGPIVRGSGLPGDGIAADDLASLIGDVAEAESIDALVLRIDSPGGSAVASETVAHQIRAAVDAGKPVVVSMGDVAASGGYWIAMGADRIVAQPGTITGSIGVIAAKPVLREALADLDVNVARIAFGEHADLWSLARPFDPSDRARVEELVEETYQRFKQGVAEGRDLPIDRVEEIARGRVWSGQAGADNGLVDTLGGLLAALDEIRELLQLDENADLNVEFYPRQEGPFEAVTALFEESGPFELLGRALAWARLATDGGVQAVAPAPNVR